VKLWQFLPARIAHELAPLGLSMIAANKEYSPFLWQSFMWKHLFFPNRLGIAGGVDKNGTMLESLQKLGAGFLEVGTVTPRPQNSNPGKIIDRDWEHHNLWNKMGFPSYGCDDVFFNIFNAKENITVPIFVNVGKNRETTNDCANQDYEFSIERLAPVADAFVVNVSSPNTLGLRALQSRAYLESLVKTSVKAAKSKPVFVKLSPDLSDEDLETALEASLSGGASGFILTNTTVSRPLGCLFPKEGGISGADLAELSKKTLKKCLIMLGQQRTGLLIVSVGGILTPKDALERLELGADLVQTYSGLIFYGPDLFFDTARLALSPPAIASFTGVNPRPEMEVQT
jgi:dihydroorotate dehydrogenase